MCASAQRPAKSELTVESSFSVLFICAVLNIADDESEKRQQEERVISVLCGSELDRPLYCRPAIVIGNDAIKCLIPQEISG
jgi:hypothetical protein